MNPSNTAHRTDRSDPSDLSLPTRRDAVKTALTLLAGANLAPLTSFAESSAQKRKRVIVAGGGIAGLCCAYELMERGHDVTVLEASRRTGGHVKTIRDPLPDGLYADVGAEHFTKPGYTQYWKYVEKFDLPALPWARRDHMYRHIDGKWFTEEQLADRGVLKAFGFHDKEIAYIVEHGWTELPSLYFDPYAGHFKDEYQPFGAGLDHLDTVVLGDLFAQDGASDAAIRFISTRRTTAEHPAAINDSSALFRIWQAAIVKMRGLPNFKKEVFHLKGGNQLLPDTFAAKLGERVRKNCPVTAIERGDSSVTVHFTEAGKPQQLTADYLAVCMPPILLSTITVTPAWPEAKAYAIENTSMGMQSRVLLQARTPFWKGDLPSINLESGDAHMGLVYQTAADVPGERCVLMGSGMPAQSSEEALAAFRKFYPGKAKDTIEQCIVHEWWKEEPTCFACERHSFPFAQLHRIWPHLIEPVGRIHFAGAAYDNLPWGQDAATRSANRIAEAIHAA